jgi:hypothetical protein
LGPDGRALDRAGYLDATFAPGQRDALRAETEVRDFAAVRTGDTLVLSYEEVVRTAVGAQSFAEHLRRLDTYVRQGADWHLLATTAVHVPEAPSTIALTAEDLEPYVGSYDFGPGLVSTVRVEAGRLIEQTTGQPQTELLPVGRDLFYAPPDVEARVEFERGPDGAVTAQIYRSGSQVLRAPRTVSAPR